MFEGIKKKVEDAVSQTMCDSIKHGWEELKPFAKDIATDILAFKILWDITSILKCRATRTHIYYHFK